MSDLPPRAAPGTESRFSAIARRELDGGVRRDRTDDLMLAKHALYQLSYDPSSKRPAKAGSTLGEEGNHRSVCPPEGHTKCGGPRRTRTADLTLIRRVL